MQGDFENVPQSQGLVRVRRVLAALDAELFQCLVLQASASEHDQWVLICRAETVDDLSGGMMEPVDDIIVDPTSWPGGRHLAASELAQLADAWNQRATHPRMVVFARPSGSTQRLVRQFLARIPASWRDAPWQDAFSIDLATAAVPVHPRRWPRMDQLDRILLRVRASPAEWTPKRVAAELGCSEKTINRFLAFSHRPSLARLIRSARLSRAHHLIRQGGGSLVEIARVCGWSDVRALRQALDGHVRIAPDADTSGDQHSRLPSRVPE